MILIAMIVFLAAYVFRNIFFLMAGAIIMLVILARNDELAS